MVNIVKNDNFASVEKANVAVVDFSATWCGPCRMTAPVLERISEKMAGKVEFYNVDVDENGELANRFNITNIPCIILLKNGVEASRTVGFQPEPNLTSWIESNL
jgi:thioredoxin 1